MDIFSCAANILYVVPLLLLDGTLGTLLSEKESPRYGNCLCCLCMYSPIEKKKDISLVQLSHLQ